MANGVFRAYWVGGVICVIGQLINDVFSYGLKWGMQSASTATSICLIFIASLLTGLGVYDKIGKYAGAGSIVPITGFANSVVSPAMEFRREADSVSTEIHEILTQLNQRSRMGTIGETGIRR